MLLRMSAYVCVCQRIRCKLTSCALLTEDNIISDKRFLNGIFNKLILLL